MNIFLPMAQVALTVYVIAAVQENMLFLPMLILVRTGQIVSRAKKYQPMALLPPTGNA